LDLKKTRTKTTIIMMQVSVKAVEKKRPRAGTGWCQRQNVQHQRKQELKLLTLLPVVLLVLVLGGPLLLKMRDNNDDSGSSSSSRICTQRVADWCVP
jgi:hypothetical protein